MGMKLIALASLALGVGAWNASAIQDPEVKVEIVKVTDQISMLVGEGGNIGIMNGADGLLMIDTQFAHMEAPIRTAIAEISAGNPAFVVNTHWHGDHVGGNLAFATDSYVVAHQNVRSRMKSGKPRGAPADPAALPDLTFGEGMTMHYNGQPVHLVHMPTGHTDGDTVVYFPQSNVVHMGDLMFNAMFPFVDIDSGGSVRGYLAALRSVYERVDDQTKIIPGHGKLASKKDLAEIIEMLESSIAMVEERIESGMTAQENVTAGISEKYASWSWRFIPTDKWLATVYRDLSAEKQGD